MFGFVACAVQAANPAPAQAGAQGQSSTAQSAQGFVQGFYDWYVGDVQESEKAQDSGKPEPAEDTVGHALKSTRWPLSDKIVKALKADRSHPASSEEVDSLDMDPFLDAQDDCFPYKTGKVTQAGSRYQVEVFDSNCSDPGPQMPTVVAEVEQHDGKWVFMNFLYPKAKTDLLSVLKGLQEERAAHPKQDPKQSPGQPPHAR